MMKVIAFCSPSPAEPAVAALDAAVPADKGAQATEAAERADCLALCLAQIPSALR